MRNICIHFLLILSLFIVSGCAKKNTDAQTDRYLVGAHFYSWYPKNWGSGCVIRLLEPEQSPWLGYYDSWDIEVAEQQIAWCSQYGVDFLTLDWWPGRDDQSKYIQDVFLKTENINDIKFCIFYETWSLNFQPGFAKTTFNDDVIEKFVEDIREIADNFFSHPSYLKVQGRPVIVLYLARTFSGDFPEAIERARSEVKSMGYDLFVIGDEVFWKVSPVVEKGKLAFPLVTEPQVSRIKCFDCITSYNMYEGEMPSHQGYGADSTYMKDVAGIYREYIDATDDEVYFAPQIMPGYNDRGGRLLSNHHVIPRRWTAESEEGSFFAESFDELAFKFVDPKLNMIFITSWNEWIENTAIEPVKPSPVSSLDKGSGGTNYTCGYKFSGYGMTYLEVIRDKVVAVYGRIVDEEGNALPGISVTVQQNAVTVEAKTDSKGYYRISRLKLLPGECDVTRDGEDPVVIKIRADRAKEVSFISLRP